MSDSLKHQAVKGVMWSAVERFSVQGVQFILSLIIARLISPSDYGMIAMLNIFLAIAQTFIDSGFSNALIQKQNRTDVDLSTVFYFNIIVSLVIYTILYFSAPFIAEFYREPKLTLVCRWISLNLIINAFSIVQRTKLILMVNFKKMAKISMISVVISGSISVILAWYGYGVWTLVVQSLTSALVNTILLWIYVFWFPKRVFSVSAFKSMFSFGSKLLIGGLLHTIYTNLYTLVIGRSFTTIDVGYFSRAQSLANFPSLSISETVNRATYPLLCGIQDQEFDLIHHFLRILRSVVFIVFPLMIGLAILSKPLILILLTDKWEKSSILLSILCISYMWYPIMQLNWQLLNVKGRSDLALKSEIIKKIFALLILIVTMQYDLKVICYGLIVYSILDIGIILYLVNKILPINLKTEFLTILPALVISIMMGIVVYCINMFIQTNILKLIVGIIVGIAVYTSLAIFFKFHEIEYLLSKIIKKK